MSDWHIHSDLIELTLKDGIKIYPSAVALLEQAEYPHYEYDGEIYEPISSIGLRFSRLGQSPNIEFKYIGELISIELTVCRKGKEYRVPKYNGLYMDYIICDGVFYYLSGPYTALGKYIQDPQHSTLSVSEYLECTHMLSESKLFYQDHVRSELLRVKNERCSSLNQEISLKLELYDYQKIGASWLTYMTSHGCGCILGDEMGLGKTAQVIALFMAAKAQTSNAHFLVVCPLSLLENWQREIAKFAPSLKVLVHHGPKRTGDYHYLLAYDVVIKSYSSIENDCGMLQMVNWNILAADEAQNIKNPNANRTQAIKLIPAKTTIAVTGTPFENHMSDIWSLVDFVLPGYLGAYGDFTRRYDDDLDSAYRLEPYLTPLMIRRKAKDVLKSLPPRVDIPQPIRMTEKEALYYTNSARTVATDASLNDHQLQVIQLLRLFCTHPFIYDKSLSGDPVLYSNKYVRLCELLCEIFDSREKVIVFTSFREMIQLLVEDIRRRFYVYTDYIDGTVSVGARQKIIDNFSDHQGPAMLVLNPVAAGAGLNITAANHVIHYNLEWNPSKEDQASARAYRNGQEKTVFVHRLYYEGTIEEFIDEKIRNKRELSSSAVIGTLGTSTSEDLRKVLTLSPLIAERYDNNESF